jgi:lysophospholipase L1-like esterase
MNETYFKSEYTKLVNIVKEANPETKIILQSIFPVAKSYVNKISINNKKIADANTWIVAIAKETGVKYANTASVLIGSNGYLPEEYQNGDGLHLNEISFAIELDYLRTHAYPEETAAAAKETEP